VDQRHGNRGLHAGHHFDVTRVGTDIADHDGLLRGDDPAHDAARNGQLEAGRVGIPDRVGNLQLVVLFVEQVHGEGVELDEPADQIRDALQQFVEIDDGRDLAAQVEQREQYVPLAQTCGLRPGRADGWWCLAHARTIAHRNYTVAR
jgi:hypothetical protein